MEKKIEEAILFLAGQIKNGVTADDALKYTQASLNLANTAVRLQDVTVR